MYSTTRFTMALLGSRKAVQHKGRTYKCCSFIVNIKDTVNSSYHHIMPGLAHRDWTRLGAFPPPPRRAFLDQDGFGTEQKVHSICIANQTNEAF